MLKKTIQIGLLSAFLAMLNACTAFRSYQSINEPVSEAPYYAASGDRVKVIRRDGTVRKFVFSYYDGNNIYGLEKTPMVPVSEVKPMEVLRLSKKAIWLAAGAAVLGVGLYTRGEEDCGGC